VTARHEGTHRETPLPVLRYDDDDDDGNEDDDDDGDGDAGDSSSGIASRAKFLCCASEKRIIGEWMRSVSFASFVEFRSVHAQSTRSDSKRTRRSFGTKLVDSAASSKSLPASSISS